VNLSIRTLIKNSIGFILLPFVVASVVSFVSVLCTIAWFSYPAWLFWLGGAVFLVCNALNKNASFSYILGHEMLHACASLLCGGKLLSIFISHKQGNVLITKDNFIVSLVPYCIPVYATLLMLIYYVLSIVVPTHSFIPLGIFLFGFTLAHHIVLTLWYSAQGQSDIKAHGFIFSGVVIIFVNIVMIVILLSFFMQNRVASFFYTNLIHALTVIKR